MGNKQAIRHKKSATRLKARGKTSIHGITPHMSLLHPGDKDRAALKPAHLVQKPTLDGRSKIPVSRNYLAVIKKRQELSVEPPVQRFSIMSQVSNRGSSEMVVNPLSTTSSWSDYLLEPLRARPARASLTPSSAICFGSERPQQLKNKDLTSFGQNADLPRKVNAWAVSAWLQDEKTPNKGLPFGNKSRFPKLSASEGHELKEKRKLLADKSTMTMTLSEFAHDTMSKVNVKQKHEPLENASTKSKSKPMARSRKPGVGSQSNGARSSIGTKRRTRRRKTKSKITGRATSRKNAPFSHLHRQPRGYYALNDPKIVARVSFEDRNKQFLYKMAAAATMRQNYGMLSNHHNLHQNYFRS